MIKKVTQAIGETADKANELRETISANVAQLVKDLLPYEPVRGLVDTLRGAEKDLAKNVTESIKKAASVVGDALAGAAAQLSR